MAKKSLILNTSCKAVFKNGSTLEFASIEEASEKTGISINAIKIRCNKPDTKVFPKFQWLDQHTAAHYRAKRSKVKGSNWEYKVRDDLNAAGYNVVTAKGESKSADNGKLDIIGDIPFSCQCKATQVLPNYFKIKEECIDKEKPFCIMWKKQSKDYQNSPGSLAIIPYEYFLKLISK